MRRKPKLIKDLQIVDIADRGKAIGKDAEGQVYLVNDVVPGDVVDFLYYKKKKGLRAGKVEAITTLSEDRTAAKCEHFGVCGGCKWQHMKYESQLKFKENSVKSAIKRLAKDDEAKVESIMGCEDIFYYRNKMEYTFSTTRWLTEEEVASGIEYDNKNALGFHRPGSFNKIVPIEQCHLQNSFADKIRLYVRDYAFEHGLEFYDFKYQNGFLRNLIIRNTSLNEWMIVLSVRRDDEHLIPLLDGLKTTFPEITSLNYVINAKANDTLYDQEIKCYAGAPFIQEKLGDCVFKIGPKSFFQTNSRQAEKLYQTIVDFAEFDGTENIYDLYTGLGSIALFVSKYCKSVVGIEEVAPAIEDAKVNAEHNKIENCSFYAGDVKLVMNDAFIEKHPRPDIVITDPPRVGMHKNVVETLLDIAAPKIVYVSCNPSTQARDILLLKEKYELIKVKPVDMFPHTHHIESVALLHLKK